MPPRPLAAAVFCLALAACGGGVNEGVPLSGAPKPAPAPSTPASAPASAPASTPSAPASAPISNYTVGGTLTGLGANNQLVLNNGSDSLALTANGAFRFDAPVAYNTRYAVTVGIQPYRQTCSVSNGSGTVTAHVNDVRVSCRDL